MDFTREPLIQTVITPKEGCKIVVRNSKNSGQEEYFVDAVEVVSFGTAIFYRSLERPKAFLVPVSDYEILEVREARMVLKNVGVDRAIKIGGGRDATVRGGREHTHEKQEVTAESEVESGDESSKADSKADSRVDKKRDRRRNARRRRGREDAVVKEGDEETEGGDDQVRTEPPKANHVEGEGNEALPLTSVLTSLLPPPLTLISETIARYRDNATFKNAFFSKEEDQEHSGVESETSSTEGTPPHVALEQPKFGSFEMSEEEEEEDYHQRHQAYEQNDKSEHEKQLEYHLDQAHEDEPEHSVVIETSPEEPAAEQPQEEPAVEKPHEEPTEEPKHE